MKIKPFTKRGMTLAIWGLLSLAPTAWPASEPGTYRPNPRNFASVMQGAKLFQANCAECHGKQAEGDANWRTPGADGKFRPPPLDGTGHMWHHPLPVLLATIRDGSIAQGGSMPPWREKLSERDMIDLIAWLQTKWPKEIYQRWRQMDDRAQTRR
ncbi:MAG: cytochrome c [Proteobacteria bacterium]|nr:MAG: cytochrome c [Pseudomonadota bacterium]